jgi:hypothetical protein
MKSFLSSKYNMVAENDAFKSSPSPLAAMKLLAPIEF